MVHISVPLREVYRRVVARYLARQLCALGQEWQVDGSGGEQAAGRVATGWQADGQGVLAEVEDVG